MSKILVTGASGFLGAKIASILRLQYDVIGTYSSRPTRDCIQLDINDRDSTLRTIKEIGPDVIIHTVAYSNADKCEKNPGLAYKINHQGTKTIAEAASETSSVLFYPSSVYIFDGKVGDYTEDDEPNPLSVLGRTKVAAEREIRSNLKNYVILRFAISYGFNGIGQDNAFLGDIIEGKKLNVNNDQIRQPLLTDNLAEIIRGLIEQGACGIFNVAGPEKMTKYQLGIALEKLVRKKSVLIPVTREMDYAPRPIYGTIDTSKLNRMGFKLMPLEEGIKIIEEQLK